MQTWLQVSTRALGTSTLISSMGCFTWVDQSMQRCVELSSRAARLSLREVFLSLVRGASSLSWIRRDSLRHRTADTRRKIGHRNSASLENPLARKRNDREKVSPRFLQVQALRTCQPATGVSCSPHRLLFVQSTGCYAGGGSFTLGTSVTVIAIHQLHLLSTRLTEESVRPPTHCVEGEPTSEKITAQRPSITKQIQGQKRTGTRAKRIECTHHQRHHDAFTSCLPRPLQM